MKNRTKMSREAQEIYFGALKILLGNQTHLERWL